MSPPKVDIKGTAVDKTLTRHESKEQYPKLLKPGWTAKCLVGAKDRKKSWIFRHPDAPKPARSVKEMDQVPQSCMPCCLQLRQVHMALLAAAVKQSTVKMLSFQMNAELKARKSAEDGWRTKGSSLKRASCSGGEAKDSQDLARISSSQEAHSNSQLTSSSQDGDVDGHLSEEGGTVLQRLLKSREDKEREKARPSLESPEP